MEITVQELIEELQKVDPNKKVAIKTAFSELNYDVEVITVGSDGYEFERTVIIKGVN